jgi:adenylosuccinate synthase
MIIEPDDVRFEVETLAAAIGSTAQGVGAATARKVLRGAQGAPVRLAKDVEELRPYLCETRVLLDTAFSKGHRVSLRELKAPN